MPSNAKTAVAPDVFAYLDHRTYLADFFAAKQGRGLSYRGFSRRVGLGAPNYLKQIIDGKRRLSPQMATRFAGACGLDSESTAYFCELVAFNHASNLQDRNQHFEALSAFRRYRAAQPLELAQAAYHSNSYLPAIRELVASPAFREDPTWIAKVLHPPIKPGEAKRAITTLLELGLLARGTDGRLQQSNPILTTGPQTRGLHIANYHAAMMRQATAAMDTVVADERDISSLTMCVGPDVLPQLKERLASFRRELIAIAESSQQRDQVYQLNLQLFPLSKPPATHRK